MNIGIVILNYNDAQNTIKLIELIMNYKILNNIIVVDNNSTDDSLSQLDYYRSQDKIKVIQAERNGGYGYGNNLGIDLLKNKYNYDYIFVANPDVHFEESLLEKIVDKFEKNTEFAALSGVMLNKNKNIVKRPYWELPLFKEDLMACLFLFRSYNRLLQSFEIDFTTSLMNVEVIPGSLFGIRAESFKDEHVFDENTFLYYEENILAKKIKSKNLNLGIVTTTSFLHMHGETVKKNIKALKTYSIQLKSKYYYHTKYNDLNHIKKILLRIMLSYSLAEYFALSPIKSLFIKTYNSERKVYGKGETSSFK